MTSLQAAVKRWLVNGIVITIPLVVTVLLLLLITRFILDLIAPVIDVIVYVWPSEPPVVVVQLATVSALIAVLLIVGVLAEYTPERYTASVVHRSFESIPGIKLVYSTVRRLVYLLMSEDTSQFQEVKLVEFPHEDSYMIGFLIRDSADAIKDSVGRDDLLTIMMPLGPNPTTNGFIMHMPPECVYDVDLSVEEAIRSIVTLGVDIDHRKDRPSDDPRPAAPVD